LRSDIVEFRRVLEGATAYFAALRSNADDRKRIRALMRELERCHRVDDKVAEAKADAQFHDASDAIIARCRRTRDTGNERDRAARHFHR
jgi:DNA-binding FadR family transcriptional regulator